MGVSTIVVMAVDVTVGQFVAFGIDLVTLVWPMIALGSVVSLVQRGAASMGCINLLFEEQPAIHLNSLTRSSCCWPPVPGH